MSGFALGTGNYQLNPAHSASGSRPNTPPFDFNASDPQTPFPSSQPLFSGLSSNINRNSALNPTPPNNSTIGSSSGGGAALPALFIDALAQQFRLDPEQRQKLHAFSKLGTLGAGLSHADLATRTYTIAAIFGDAAERRRAADRQDIGNLAELFTDLKIRLEDTFVFTSEQKTNVRTIAQDIIYQATRTAFMSMHIDVEASWLRKHLRGHQESGKLENVIGNPSREKLLASLIKRTCSSVRNAFRQDIRASISVTTATSLEMFSFNSATKYKHGGPGEKLDIGFTIHNVLLRRFGLENPGPLGAEDDEAEECTDLQPLQSRKRRRTGGRIPKGEDFWSLVDVFFKKKIAELGGRTLTGPKWKTYLVSYIDELTSFDNSQFGGKEAARGPVPDMGMTLDDPGAPGGTSGSIPAPVQGGQGLEQFDLTQMF